MQLENPAKQRRLTDIIAGIPDDQRADVIRRLAVLDRLIARQHKQDTELVDSLVRVLKSDRGQELRKLIREAPNG